MRTLRAGTRGSRLARRQTDIAARALDGIAKLEPHAITTSGDRFGFEAAGDGAFAKELRHALAAGEIDCAVHSLKDLPTEPADGLVLAAVLPRSDPRDALVGATLSSLRPGSRVGTGSPRRAAMLRALRPDVEIAPLRGNVPTRVRKVLDGEIDAAVLALAGLQRLGLTEGAYVFGVDQMAPAPGQGAIAIEVRAGDADATLMIAMADDAPTRIAVEAERAVLRALGGGCMLPIGAYGLVEDGTLTLSGRVVSPDGRRVASAAAAGPVEERHDVAQAVAQSLLEQGAEELLDV